ncbi:MAG TPA: peptidylprolyl isomerase [Candidatus Thermoplasmatota archaeon]|nr:peptidylprolyl isomerase [Candidatus Thermoplasmatota archaeon]
MPQPPHNPANRLAVIETSMGTITCELFEKEAPISTQNFIKYAEAGFYEGLIFHRIIKGFMIQGGGMTPQGSQKKALAAPIKLEISPALQHWDGALCYARTMDPNSATSQFYICHGPQPGLDKNYAVFGQTIQGKDVVDQIARTPTNAADKPKTDVIIKSVKIVKQ